MTNYVRLKGWLWQLLDIILPKRSDFAITEELTAETIATLPQAEPVSGMNWIHPLFRYKDNRVRAIIWELKYRYNTKALDYIGRVLFDEIIELLSDIILFDGQAKFILMPIPISDKRRAERGYNQSEYIAKSIISHDLEHILLYAPQWLEKPFDTPRQSYSLSREERMKNLVGCFTADPRVEGHYVILIDDVTTTGSTLCEARKTLLSAGAVNVYAFTIAH